MSSLDTLSCTPTQLYPNIDGRLRAAYIFPFNPLLPPRHTSRRAAPCTVDETKLAPVLGIDSSLLSVVNCSLSLSNSLWLCELIDGVL